MANLKELHSRKKSVKSTQKITSAMKLVAAAKLKRSQELAEANQYYTQELIEIMNHVGSRLTPSEIENMLSLGLEDKTNQDQDETYHLLIISGADRGLCGGFNAQLARSARTIIQEYIKEGTPVRIICVGKKVRDALKTEFESLILNTLTDVSKPRVRFSTASDIGRQILGLLFKGEARSVSVIYTHYKSVMGNSPRHVSLIPLELLELNPLEASQIEHDYEFEPWAEQIFKSLLPSYINAQIYRALLQTQACEQAARMMAMENATKNASDMIKRLDLQYNRTRQALITKELIEIISGAEAL